MRLIRNLIQVLIGILGFAALIVVSHFTDRIAAGTPKIPTLEEQWWGGYYDSTLFGRQWCLARFITDQDGDTKLLVWGSFGPPDIFNVKRHSRDRTFVHYTFEHSEVAEKIKATQLYVGKRYWIQFLLAGRFTDFWRKNSDAAIRGSFIGQRSKDEFNIEPLNDDAVDQFWSEYVRPKNPQPFPEEFLMELNSESISGNDPFGLLENHTPDKIVQDVKLLASAYAVLKICFENEKKFEALSTESALKLFDLDSRLDRVVEQIAADYNDDALYLFYHLESAKLSLDDDLIMYAQSRFDTCSIDLIRHTDKLVNDVESYFQDMEDKQ